MKKHVLNKMIIIITTIIGMISISYTHVDAASNQKENMKETVNEIIEEPHNSQNSNKKLDETAKEILLSLNKEEINAIVDELQNKEDLTVEEDALYPQAAVRDTYNKSATKHLNILSIGVVIVSAGLILWVIASILDDKGKETAYDIVAKTSLILIPGILIAAIAIILLIFDLLYLTPYL